MFHEPRGGGRKDDLDDPPASMLVSFQSQLQPEDEAAAWAAKAQTHPAPTGHLGQQPVPQLELVGRRFAAIILGALAILIGVMLLLVHGVTIDRDVSDTLGSSKNADERIELYQTINGFITAAIGELVENAFAIFLAVLGAYLGNVRMYPGDDPTQGVSRRKVLLLVVLGPALMFVMNVAISAAFVQHKAVRIDRIILSSDLKATGFSVANSSENATSTGAGVSIQNTILRSSVRRHIVPFQVIANSSCGLGNESFGDNDMASFPIVQDIKSTSVVYGFPNHEWNLDALPIGLTPSHSVHFDLSETNDEKFRKQFAEFQGATNVSWITLYEMLLQGKLMFERSISDSDETAVYPCVLSDGRIDKEKSRIRNMLEAQRGNQTHPATNSNSTTKSLRRRRLLDHVFFDGRRLDGGGNSDEDSIEVEDEDADPTVDYFETGEDHEGFRKCYGAQSSLHNMSNYMNASMHNIDVFLDTMVDGILHTIETIEPESMNFKLETFEINPQISLTTMTLDIPFFKNVTYRDVAHICNGNKLKPEMFDEMNKTLNGDKEQIETAQAILCDQQNYPYVTPKAACGESNCVFIDESKGITFKKQLQLIPYLTGCSTKDMRFDSDYRNFFPTHCKRQQDAVFLYGLGSYISGDSFSDGVQDGTGLPFISAPRRHVVLTFAKLEWRLEDLSKRFQAQCDVPHGCDGLLHKLENVTVPVRNQTKGDKYTRILMVGKDNIPQERMEKDYRNPVQLVSLNTRLFHIPDNDEYVEWEIIDKKQFKKVEWPKRGGLNGSMCSPVVDAYLAQMNGNHFYLDNPTQPLYTSAFFYLFQDAAMKSVKLYKNMTTGKEVLQFTYLGTTKLNGDLERKEIKFSIPLLSMISTFTGLGLLWLLTLLVICCPRERIKMTETTNTAGRYTELVVDDQYPEEVCERTFRLPSGEKVPLDEYVVDSITFHHNRDEDKKIYL